MTSYRYRNIKYGNHTVKFKFIQFTMDKKAKIYVTESMWKMIRRIETKDYETAINIVNENWKSVYAGYVNSDLLSDIGCQNRAAELQKDFFTCRQEEYVWEEDKKILALLSFGKTEDYDKPGVFEIWRVYVSKDAQGKGIGKCLLRFAEQKAEENGYKEIIIWAFKNNYRAVNFYIKAGYQVDKEEYLGEPYGTYGIRLIKRIR